MRRLLVAMLLMVSVLAVGCTDDTPKTPELVSSNKNKCITDLDSVDSIRLLLDGKELVFPDDFTYSKLSSGTLRVSGYDGTFIPTVDEDGILDLKYSDALHVKYYPDSYLVSNIDSMYLTGFTYSGEEIEILSDLSTFGEDNIGGENTKVLTGLDYTVRLTERENGEKSISVVCDSPDKYFRLEQEYEVAEDIVEYDITEKELTRLGGITVKTGNDSIKFPEDISGMTSIPTTVKYNYAFFNENPTYIVEEVLTGNKICGIILVEDGTGLPFVKIGDSVFDTMEDLGFPDGIDYKIIKLVSDDVDFDIYLENKGNVVNKIMLVEKNDVIMEE